MISDALLDEQFRYHPPTPETAPRFQAIRQAEADAHTALVGVRPGAFAAVNDAARAFADVVNREAPDSADKAAAIRCIRLARNAANELAVLLQSGGGDLFRRDVLVSMIEGELMKARWQACAAVALNGL